MICEVKSAWREEKAEDVIGPVANGERIRDRNGESIAGRGRADISEHHIAN
jgi:hypothetical protein